MRQLLLATALAMPLAMPAMAQQADAPEGGASLKHSALKATTFKAGSTVTNLVLLSYAAGGIGGGIALSAFMLGASWAVYTANDYFWDTYSPPPPKIDGEAFDAGADMWRTTGKFLTFKPVVASLKLASLYVYTGSAAIAATFGTAAILTNSVVFYANNMAWDWYDWYSATNQVAAQTVTAQR